MKESAQVNDRMVAAVPLGKTLFDLLPNVDQLITLVGTMRLRETKGDIFLVGSILVAIAKAGGGREREEGEERERMKANNHFRPFHNEHPLSVETVCTVPLQ